MHLIRAPNGKICTSLKRLLLARETDKSDEKKEGVIEKMDVEMEDIEAQMEKESTPATSRRVSRTKLLAKK